VFDLEFGQLNSDVASATIGGLQKLFQLDAVLQVQFLHFGQTVLLLWHDHVQGQLLLLSRKTNDFNQFIFVVLEATFGFP